MAWSITLPQTLFTSPILSVATPIATGNIVGLLIHKHSKKPTKKTYRTLHQPPGSPPAWLFAPVWVTLYGLMGYAIHHATLTLPPPQAHKSQLLFTAQLALNHAWMPLFFTLGRPGLALADLGVLSGLVGSLMAGWWAEEGCKRAFWCLVPYAAWLGYAGYLNAGFGWLNGWTVHKEEEAKKE